MDSRSLLRIAGRSVAAVVAGLIIAAAGSLLVVPPATGSTALTVLSGSMEPNIPQGSVVFVRPMDPADIVVGDVITYTPSTSGALTTHRVVGVEVTPEGRVFETKGDANDTPDIDPVHEDAVHGRMMLHLPFLGRAREEAGSPRGMAVVGGALFLLMGGDAIRKRRSPSDPGHSVGEVSHEDRPSGQRTWSPTPRRGESGPNPATSTGPMTPTPPVAGRETRTALEIVPFAGTPIPSGQSDGLAQLMMARIHLPTGWRSEILQVCTQAGGTVIASGPTALVLTFTGTPVRLDEIEKYLTSQTAVTVQRTPVLSTSMDDQPSRDEAETDPPALSSPEPPSGHLSVVTPTSTPDEIGRGSP